MAKQAIISAMEEVIGEYVVNIDTENLKVAALRGKIKLENVQLDGDLLGSHILGSMGLSGFGILSSWAKSVKITVPLKNLEKEPTRIEIRGCHVLCVPLLPSTASKMFGAGTLSDPRCTLRTRAKRCKLARFEKNFMTGRIPDEGPVEKRILRAVKNVERDLKKKSKRRKSQGSKQQKRDEIEDDFSLNSFISDLGDGDSTVMSATDRTAKDSICSQDLPELPRDWKVKLREKMLRNMEASLLDIHIRCEVSEGGLDFCHPDDIMGRKSKRRTHGGLKYDQRSFAFGVTLDQFVVRTANEKWEAGSHEKTQQTSVTDQLGPNPYDARNNKIISWENCAMYWDDDPPFLISETEVTQSNDHKLSADKFHGRIAAAMSSLYHQQEPGQKIRESLQLSGKKRSDRDDDTLQYDECPHQYIFKEFKYQVRQRLSNRMEPGPISCQAEFFPFELDIKFRPHQFVQYQKLKSAMLFQQRFDTMLRHRPTQSPLQNPREWWQYAIGCITTRPNSRPWQDVVRIGQSRQRYIDLVVRKVSRSEEYSGFHGGLSNSESADLLILEDILPIEALLAFHLVALRRATSPDPVKPKNDKGLNSPARGRRIGRSGFGRLFRSRSRSRIDGENPGSTPLKPPPTPSAPSAAVSVGSTSMTLLEAMTVRLGRKVWMSNMKLFHGRVTITLLTASDEEIVKLICEMSGTVRTFGYGKMDFYFDVTKFEAVESQPQSQPNQGRTSTNNGKILVIQGDPEEVHGDDPSIDLTLTSSFGTHIDADACTSFIDLPPVGVVCRLAAAREKGSTKFSISSHPATLMWTRPCFDALAEFFGAPSTQMQTELTSHLKHAATPLARKAQLAFLSQSTLVLHCNVAAPKIWVPFTSQNGSDGALQLDAGNFRMSFLKEDGQPNMTWKMDARDMQVNFARWRLSEVREKIASPAPFAIETLYTASHGVNSIIRPFQVHAINSMRHSKQIPHPLSDSLVGYTGIVSCIDISVSPICLNLVDAEVLARAIGKWYSQGLVSVRGRVSTRSSRSERSIPLESVSVELPSKDIQTIKKYRKSNATPHTLSLTVEKFEMAIEGHSKSNFPDEKSIESHETSLLGDFAPPTRTYLVEVFDIVVHRARHQGTATTKLLVADASIIQLKDPSEYFPMKERHEADECQYSILEHGKKSQDDEQKRGEGSPRKRPRGSEVLSVSLFHDSYAHLDEVEVDIDSIILRVTPTSLKDCTKGIRKIVELIQLMTREMERKVHEEGRKAREKGRDGTNSGGLDEHSGHRRPVSPAFSLNSEASENHAPEESPVNLAHDSSLLFKVTIRNGTLLAGRPTFARQNTNSAPRLSRFRQSYSFAVVQVLSNALIMFQSIENPDASGTKTLHISLDNLSASVDTAFDRVPASKVPPMIGPTGAEFRVVYSTENLGCVVSNDISLDCEYLRSCLTPNDLSIFISIVSTMLERLKGVQIPSSTPDEVPARRRDSVVTSLVRYRKSGSGVATNIRAEFQTFSFVVLRTYQSKYGAPELLSFDLNQLKAKLGGCMSALSGECTAGISVGFFNSDVSAWEYAVEPFPIRLSIDQMPNELVLEMAPEKPIQFNLTGLFLRDFSQLDFGFTKAKEKEERPHVLTPSALSTVGLRRATEAHSVVIHNFTGIDIDVSLSGSLQPEVVQNCVRFDSMGPGVIKNQSYASLDSLLEDMDAPNNFDAIAEKTKLSLKLPASSADLIGEREPLHGLPIASNPGDGSILYVLKPSNNEESFYSKRLPSHHQGHESGRTSPETVMTEATRIIDYSYYHAEPVVEWCMQNQRLRSNTVDVYSLEKGKDLLSSSVWSPEEEYNIENIHLPTAQTQDPNNLDPLGEDTPLDYHMHVSSPGRKGGKLHPGKSNWLRPYLKNDSPEWTDMTCILRMARERVMLPDPTWIWVNDWSVDVSGEFGESTDADGWEYQADFETFTRTRRFYNRGDSCRRRRWTRTRIVKPPALDDPSRLLNLVWETSRDEGGNFKIEVKSHVSLHNSSGTELDFFVFSPSWGEEKHIGSCLPGATVHVPVALASAVYLRLAKSKSSNPSSSIQDYVTTERIMILPTSFNSSVWIRSSMTLGDVSETDLHFMLHIVCKKGIVNIFVGPVMQVLNLLPCQIECQLGEALRPSDKRQMDSRPVVSSSKRTRIANVETLKVASGKEGKCIAVNPASKPHISLRVPGYKWSAWQRIVNRKSDSYTWRPSDSEDDLFIYWNRGEADHAEEFKIRVHFERFGRTGDPLVLIIGVECGLVPTVRVYAQYWIVDKTGFGCHFCESFTDLLGTTPDIDCSRRSHLLREDARDQMIRRDMNSHGHEWSIGQSGMTLYFSLRERIALAIESGAGDGRYADTTIRSKWTSPMDISNVMPKTVFSVDELGGPRRFELAISVTVCPGIFSRTRLITLIPRYQIVNLLKRELVVAQNGCLKAETLIPSQSSVPFHWERQALPPKVRLGAPTIEEKDYGEFDECWTNGCIQLDKIGITSMRLPTVGLLPTKPMVVQAEVRLASKEQNSAVVIVIWSTNEKSNPLYLLRNRTRHTILCRQPLQDEQTELVNTDEGGILTEACGSNGGASVHGSTQRFECGNEFGPIIRSFLGLDRIEEFVWVLRSGDVACFGFDDPEKPHILEWACMDSDVEEFEPDCKKAFVEIDAMGTTSSLAIGSLNEVQCQIGAEHSTKVIEFVEKDNQRSSKSLLGTSMKKGSLPHQLLKEEEQVSSDSEGNDDEEEDVAFSLRIDIPVLSISVIDNADPSQHGREILLTQLENIYASFSQSREGYHEMELRVLNLQVDNHVPASIHPVLIFCPKSDDKEPVLHMSAVRRLQQHSTTYVFRYAAFRLLEVNMCLDRRTAETIARFIEPVRAVDDGASSVNEAPGWVSDLTIEMSMKYAQPDRRAPRDIEMMVHTANSGRFYFEQLHLHPVRIALTFTQEWMELNQDTESLMVFQFIRGMASIADAPLTFTSFVVSHVFESPQALLRVIAVHYSSQLTKQIFGILGSLAILGAPADFISNVGTGVRDFFYEPIQGAVHGPRQFIEGLEAGTQSLARGVFVGVVRGAANVTEVVNANLAGLTADDDFIDERKAHQRMLTDAMSRGVTSRTFSDSLYLAGASIARGVRSGAYGIVEQPTRYASKHGPVGFVKGMGKAFVGAVVKPVVGVGDAAALIMNHVSDATSNKQVQAKIPKRLRRALPSISVNKPNCVNLRPYDERAAKAQKIVTGGESVNDVYIGHVNIPSHLIIASDQCLWAIDRRSREPWCVSWEEISHFGRVGHGMRIVVFSQTGLRPYVFQVDDSNECNELQKLLSMHLGKMGNAMSNLSELNANEGLDVSLNNLPGIKSRQEKHVFGSCNQSRRRLANTIKDEIDLIEQCFSRVKKMGSESNSFFKTLDDEAWTLVSCWGQVFSGLSSRRCIAASVINGTGNDIQIKSTKLVEGGSPCYSIPTKEFDPVQGVLHAGGVIIFFGWGVVPSLLQAGNVFMHIETNAFIADLADQKNRDTYTEALPGYQVGFLEKSYDDAGWWGKYWLLIREQKS